MKVWCSRCGTYVLPYEREEAARMCFDSGCQPKCMNKVAGEVCKIPLEQYASQGSSARPIDVEPCLDTSHLSNAAYRAAAPMPDIPVE